MAEDQNQKPASGTQATTSDDVAPDFVTPRFLFIRGCWRACHRPLVLCLEGVAMLTGLLVILTLALAWRLSSGPITIDFLTDEIETALTNAMAPLSVHIGAAAIRWDNDDDRLRLTGQRVRLLHEDGSEIGQVPQLDVALSLSNLLRGNLVIKQATLQRPFIRLTRNMQGQLDIDFAGIEHEGTAPDAPPDQALQSSGGDDAVRALLDMLTPADGGQIAGGLESLEIANGSFQFVDLRAGYSVRLDEASLSVAEADNNLTLIGTTRAYTGRGDTVFRASGRIEIAADTGDIETSIGIRDLDLAALQRVGNVHLPAALLALPLSSIAADLSYDNARNTFAINDLTGQLGQAGFNLAGNAYRVGNHWLGAVVATVDQIDVPTALSYVPTDANIDAANWARMNMTKGVVNNLQIYLTGQVAANDMTEWQVTDLFGDFGLTDMSVQYQWALPPATDVVGQGRFDREAVIIDLTEGRIDTVLASDTQIVINDFDAEHPALVVTGRAIGPFKDILTALNHPRFGYADYLGLNLRELGGTVDANMRFALPLNATLRAEQVEVDIDGKLIGVKTNGLFGGLPIRKANLDTVISGEGLVARGSVEAGGMPLTINWHQYFDADAEVATALDFRGTITDRNLADLGLNTAPYLTGSIGVDGRVVDYNGGNTDIQMTATLGDARLAVPEIDFKPEPTPGSLLASISILPDDTISITSASLSSNAITVDASAVFNPDGSYGVRASRLQWGGTDVSFGFDAAADGAWEVVLEGASLDLRHLLGRDREPADDPAQSDSNANSRPFGWLLDSSALVADDGPTREITYAVEKVITNDDIGFTKVRGRIALTPQNWPSLLVRGELGDVPVSAEISGTRPNPLKVRFESGDLGALLAAYDADIPLIGGRFVFDGTGEPWSRGDVTLNGTVDLQDFRLGEAAVLSRTVDALSRGGLTTINENAGLGFRQFTADIALDKGQLTVREGRARGAQFGFTLGGAVDLSNETLDLNGTLVPIYTLNRWIGAIPVIGTLLTGGEGEGLFAANYTVDGSFAEPDIKINPLSALAPGIIRKLLFAQDDNSIPSDATKEIDPPPGMVDHGG